MTRLTTDGRGSMSDNSASPHKLRDRTVKTLDGGTVQFSSPGWDWVTWENRVLFTFTPNYHGLRGASLFTAKECRALAAELERRAADLDQQQNYRRSRV